MMSVDPIDLAKWEIRLFKEFASEVASSVGHGDHGDPPGYLASLSNYIRHKRADIPSAVYQELSRRYY